MSSTRFVRRRKEAMMKPAMARKAVPPVTAYATELSAAAALITGTAGEAVGEVVGDIDGDDVGIMVGGIVHRAHVN